MEALLDYYFDDATCTAETEEEMKEQLSIKNEQLTIDNYQSSIIHYQSSIIH